MIELNLMDLSDCFTPEQLVAEIYNQCPNLNLPIPIEEIAKAAGIEAIKAMPTDDVEGMLVADEGKRTGVIFYKESSPRGRQRFTIGHELGHFLLLHHGAKQSCFSGDIRSPRQADDIQKLETEANQFSQLLLMPDNFIEREINRVPLSMEALKEISDRFDMSFEAIANKCANHSSTPFALVYSKNGIVRYCWRDWTRFPHRIPLKSGCPLPLASSSLVLAQEETISELSEVDAWIWIEKKHNKPHPPKLIEQTYTQLGGYKVTMLRFNI